MRRREVKHYCFLVMVLATSIFYYGNVTRVGKASKQSFFVTSDALIPPDIPPKHNSSIIPGYYETSEYLIGSVAVGIVFLESNGATDPSTEDWTPTQESSVISEIRDSGLSRLANYNPDAGVSFVYEIHYRVPTNYEPINRPSTDERLWIHEAMTYLGYPGTDYFSQVRDYVNDLRDTVGTDWAFTIFVVDSYHDSDGMFTDDEFAYAYLGGPFLVMTYDNNGWGIGDMDNVVAHETAHIFYATDEYDGVAEYSGYLNTQDDDGAYCIMNNPYVIWTICPSTQGQLGWRDTDGDGIQDIVDTFPDTTLNPHSSNPTYNTTLAYTGSVSEIPYPNNNPHGTLRDVTINTIPHVQFRMDYGAWINATATDGIFDEAVEDFTFTTSSLSLGTHTIETRGINSAGNAETSYSSDTVTTIADSNPPTTIHEYDVLWHTTDFTINLTATDDLSGVAKTYYKINDGLTKVISIDGQPLITTESVNNSLEYWSLDNIGNEELPHKILTGIKLDKIAPTGSITINDEAIYTNTNTVTLTISATDTTSAIAEMRFSNDNITWTPWEAYTAFKAWTLTKGNGTNTVYYRARDHAGLVSDTYSDTIVLDTKPPKILGTSPSNGTEIKSSTFVATWSGVDVTSGIDHYEVALDDGSWINAGTNTTYTFIGRCDGSHVLDIKAIDRANNHRIVRIRFSVNTSLIGGPGWTDDVVVFGILSFLIAGVLLFFVRRRRAT